MNKARSNFIYSLPGEIKEKVIKLSSKGKYKGENYYQLKVKIYDNERIETIQAFKKKLLNEDLWEKIVKDKYIGKTYILKCKNYMGYYYLVDWKLGESVIRKNKKRLIHFKR